MGKKDDLIAKATELGIEFDSRETIADLEAKIGATELAAMSDDLSEGVEVHTVIAGSSAWAMAALVAGQRVMREAWLDNRHFDPAHIRAGIRLSFEDVQALDWKLV